MTTARGRRGPAFSMRQTALAFGLAAALLCGAGLALRSLVRAAGAYGPFVLALAVLVATALLVTAARSRRRPRAVAPPPAEGAMVPAAREPAAWERAEPGPVGESVAPEPEPVRPEPVEPVPESGPVDFASMDPLVFEQAVAALCERDGCRDVTVDGGAGDLGADVTATSPGGLRVVIQCKRYGPVNKVGSQDTQRFGGTCFAVHEADVAAIVTTGEFTRPAADYAAECGIHCFDHRALAAWADRTGPAPWEAAVPAPGTPVE
ncbi:restriction endonuclease [Streptomyces sp. NPDC001889]